ncbi:MAG: Flp family type IVb pilin [Acidimicrobiia bacterium]
MNLFILRTWLSARLNIQDERGASLVEYALLVALIAIVAVAAITLLGKNATSKLNSAANSLS